MKYHLTAIGGAVMHNLAIALKEMGHFVSGSDDHIFEPSRSRLNKHGLLPVSTGWYPEKISGDLDVLILGMHARKDNPELLKAEELGIPVMSFPEFVYSQSKTKKRVAICGSHGKTTLTAMVMHCLRAQGMDFDYLVGAQLDGFETMVRISDAPLMIIEGDEYLASPLHPKPKFLYYHPQICLITGIAWDHINVFPSFDEYTVQFRRLINSLNDDAELIYFGEDELLCKLVEESSSGCKKTPYYTPDYKVEENSTILHPKQEAITLKVFGRHNLQNLEGARKVCELIGIEDTLFLQQIADFSGAARRLEEVSKDENSCIFRDFAHAPSKVRATIAAVREQFPERELIACLELHTFSSLNPEFLGEYEHTMAEADHSIVYFNPETLRAKKLPPIRADIIKQKFGDPTLIVINDQTLLKKTIDKLDIRDKNLLMMSSGHFDGLNVSDLQTHHTSQ